MRAWITALAAVLLLQACGTSRTSGLCENVVEAGQPGDAAKEEALADAAWAQRVNVDKLKEAISHWRAAVAIAPRKTANYVRLAKALYFWADGHLRFDDSAEEAMLKAFEEATYFAERALKIQNPDFQFSVCSQEPFNKSARHIRKSDVPAVYWYAAALGKYGLAKSIVTVLDNKDRIYAVMRRVRKLDPAFNYGAGDRYLGAFFTKIPFPKGDLKKSRAHFLRSLKRAPNYLATRVLMAEMLAPKLKDRAMFKEQLDYVLQAPANVVPDLKPENLIEKKKARALLEDIDTIFVSDQN